MDWCAIRSATVAPRSVTGLPGVPYRPQRQELGRQVRVVGPPERPLGLGAGVAAGPHPLVVRVEAGHRGRNRARVQAHHGRAAALLIDERVEIRRGQADAAAPDDIDIGRNLPAMHPQQQLGLVQPEPGAVGLGAGERRVQLPYPAAGPGHLVGGPVGSHADELGGAHEPAPGLPGPGERRVLPGAAHHPGVQRLQVQGAEPGHPEDRLPHDPPGHRVGTEEAAVGHGTHPPASLWASFLLDPA